MIDAFLILAGGLLGSAHCVGMCGGFVLTLGSTQSGLRANVRRQLVYSLGRILVYATAGAIVGYGGWRLTTFPRSIVNVQAALSYLAGTLLLLEGLAAAGILRGPGSLFGNGSCLGVRSFAGLLTSRRPLDVFVAGLWNGLLPCGLVYAYLALAASTGTMFGGLATMALFGLGTMPALVLTGCGGSLLGQTFRHRLFRVAAWCMVLTGILALFRGAGFLHGSALFPTECCRGQ